MHRGDNSNNIPKHLLPNKSQYHMQYTKHSRSQKPTNSLKSQRTEDIMIGDPVERCQAETQINDGRCWDEVSYLFFPLDKFHSTI